MSTYIEVPSATKPCLCHTPEKEKIDPELLTDEDVGFDTVIHFPSLGFRGLEGLLRDNGK